MDSLARDQYQEQARYLILTLKYMISKENNAQTLCFVTITICSGYTYTL